MKSLSLPRKSAAAIGLWVAALAVTPLFAQTGHGFNFTDFTSVDGISLNGNAFHNFPEEGTPTLRLASASAGQRGSAWFTTQQPVADGFTAAFTFQIQSPGLPADGLAFVVQNSGDGILALGGAGEGMGYGTQPAGPQPGIANSLAVEFDTFQNGFDPNDNHIAVQSCGTGNNVVDHSNASCALGLNAAPPAHFTDGAVHTVRIDYTSPGGDLPSNNLVVFLDDVQALAVSVDLSTKLSLGSGGVAWVGLTSATGAAVSDHDILSWSFTPHTTTSVTWPLNPSGGTQNFVCGNYNKKLLYPANTGGNLTITCTPVSPCDFLQNRLPGTGTAGALPNTSCIVYDGTGGNCVVFTATCTPGTTGSGCSLLNASDFMTSLASYDTHQVIQSPGFLSAATGTNAWENIFQSFSQTKTDPTTIGKIIHFSDFVVTSASTLNVAIASPPPTLVLGQAVNASYTCAPAFPGVSLASCVGTRANGASIDTSASQLGIQRTFSVCGTDTVGSASGAKVKYTVQYASSGTCKGDAGHRILQPISADGTSVFKAGKTVPAKFRVCNASGSSIGTTGVVTSFKLVKIVSGTVVNYVNVDVPSATPDTAFRWDSSAQQWIYNINTKGMATGKTYYYEIKLKDGTVIPFQFGLR